MIFKKFERKIRINEIEIPVQVEIQVEEDFDTNPAKDIALGSEEENIAYLKRFKSGELFCANIGVIAKAIGLDGSDWLGACHIHSNNAFNSKPFEADVMDTVIYHGMVENALMDLENSIKTKAAELARFA